MELCFQVFLGSVVPYDHFVLKKNTQMYLSEKVFLHFLPALEACMSFFDMVFLAQRVLHGDIVMYDEWLFRCSQFLVWVSLYNLSCFF